MPVTGSGKDRKTLVLAGVFSHLCLKVPVNACVPCHNKWHCRHQVRALLGLSQHVLKNIRVLALGNIDLHIAPEADELTRAGIGHHAYAK